MRLLAIFGTATLLLCLFSACMTEQEKAVQARIETLDQQLADLGPQLDALRSAMETLQQTVAPTPVRMDTTELDSSERATFRYLDGYSYRFMRGEPADLQSDLRPRVNTLGLWLNPEKNGEGASSLIRYLHYIDPQQVFEVVDRQKGEAWPLNISSPAEYHDQARRDENAAKMKTVMDQVAKVQYLIGAEELYLVPPKLLGEQQFESGKLLARIHVYDLKQGKLIESFLVKALNSSLTYTFTEDAKVAELTRDIRNQLFQTLYNRLSD